LFLFFSGPPPPTDETVAALPADGCCCDDDVVVKPGMKLLAMTNTNPLLLDYGSGSGNCQRSFMSKFFNFPGLNPFKIIFFEGEIFFFPVRWNESICR
jgi:hypothetical protein